MQSPKYILSPKNLIIILTKRIESPLLSIYDQSYDYSWLDVDFLRNLRLALSYAFWWKGHKALNLTLKAMFTTVVELRQAYAFWWNGPLETWVLGWNLFFKVVSIAVS